MVKIVKTYSMNSLSTLIAKKIKLPIGKYHSSIKVSGKDAKSKYKFIFEKK